MILRILFFFSLDQMLFEDLPCELLCEIFSYITPSDLLKIFRHLKNQRLAKIIHQMDLSLDLTGISVNDFHLVCQNLSNQKLIYLRLTNQFSHGLIVQDFFNVDRFRPNRLNRLRSLHLDDIIGNEIHFLPDKLEKLYVKFHKKAKFAIEFYRLALNSKSLKECYLIGGYAFDHQTCFPIYSSTIENLQIAVKTFPSDFSVLLRALPSLIKLKSKWSSLHSTQISMMINYFFY